jgi:hypothetical protein
MLATLQLQLGNLAEWVAALGTIAAFAATWVVISRDHKARRVVQATAAYDAALSVTVTVGPTGKTVTEGQSGEVVSTVVTVPLVTVTNNSTRTIYDVKVVALIPWGEELGSTLWDEIPPQTAYRLECAPHDDMWAEGWPAGRLNAVATITFDDAGNTTWLRDSTGTIRRSTDRSS